MKKLLLILIFFLTIFSCGNNQEIENDLTKSNIRGKVKEIIETKFDAELKYNMPEKGKKKSYKIDRYNENGNLIIASYYNADGYLTGKFEYQYDENGNLINSSHYYEDYWGEKGYRMNQYQYDKKRNLVWLYNYIVTIADTNLFFKEKYDYDKNRNVIKQVNYWDNGDIRKKEENKFNDDRNVIESVIEYPEEDIIYKLNFKYNLDKLNNWIVKIHYHNGELVEIIEREITYY